MKWRSMVKAILLSMIVILPLMAQFQLPFSDNFNDGDDSDWSWYTWVGPTPGGQPSHQVVNGVERIVTHDQNSTMLANGTTTLNNYYIEADERIVQLLDDGYGGLRLYAYANGGFGQGHSYYVFDICYRDHRWSIAVHYSDGQGETVARGNISISLNRWYRMKLEVRGDTLYAYLDGQLLGSGVPSQPLSGGMFGIGGSDDIIEVDNIHVDRVQRQFQLPFSDDFNDGDDSDWLWYACVGPTPGGQPSHQVVNGVERIVTHDQNATMLLNGTQVLRNYYIEADMRIVQLLDDSYGGLRLFAYSTEGCSPGNVYYMFDICHRCSRWKLEKHYGDGHGEVVARGNISISLNRWYRMKLEVRGDTLYAYLDGQLLGSGVPSQPLSGGMFGIGGSDDIIEVDNIHVDRVQRQFQLPFSDDFNDGDDSDWLWFTSVGPTPGGQPSHQVVNGVERIVTHDQNATMLLNGTPYLRNYYFEADFRIAQLLDDSYGGIYVYIYSNNNLSTNRTNYWLDICKRCSRWRLIAQYSSTNSEVLAQGYRSFETNRWYHIKMEVREDTVFAYLDGQLLGSGVPSTPLSGGYFGFGGSDDILEIDNVHVDYVTQQNSPPVITGLTGPATGTAGQALTFTATANDPDGDNVYIQFDWGDGNYSNWFGPSASGSSINGVHVWTAPGTYSVKARAKDINNNIGEWSQPITVNITITTVSDTLKLLSANSAPNSPVYIPVHLVNPQNVGGVQFKVHFDHTKLSVDSITLEGRASQMQIGHNIIGQDTLIVMVYSANAKKIAPGSDEILKIKFNISGSATLGDSTFLDLFDVILSDTLGGQIPCASVDAWIYFRGRKGDLNQDGYVNILDVVRAVNIALHIPPQPTNYETWAADMNDDGIVNILDIIQIVNVALSGGKALNIIKPIKVREERKEIRSSNPENLINYLQIGSSQGNPGDQVIVPVALQNSDTVGGLQFSLHFDNTILTFDSVYLSGRGTTMNLGHNLISGDTLMVMVYSTSGQRITPGSGDIINLKFTISSSATNGDTAILEITNAILSDPSGYPINMGVSNGCVYIGQGGTSINDTLRILSSWAPPGQTVTVPIELINHSPVSGIQTTIHYDPNLISYQGVQLNPAYTSFNISANNLGDSIRIVVISMQGDSIIAGADTVFSVTFTVDSNATLGDSTYLTLSSSVLSDPRANVIPVFEEGSWLYIRGQKGDLNQDGVVNVVDAVRAINIIILRPPAPTPYELWAADMNNDGTVNVVDVVAIINVILSGGKQRSSQYIKGYATLYLEGNEVILSNTSQVAGIQFDLIGKPENIHLVDRGRNLSLFTNRVDRGVRVVIVGLDGSLIENGIGPILRFNGEATIENVVISDPSGDWLKPDAGNSGFEILSLTPNPASKRVNLEFSTPKEMRVEVNLYDISGRLVKKMGTLALKPGIHILKLDTDNLRSGVYFVEIRGEEMQRVVRKFLVK